MSTVKTYLLSSITVCCFYLVAQGSTVLPPEASNLTQLTVHLSAWKSANSGDYPKSWEDLAIYDPGLFFLNIPSGSGDKPSDIYSFVPEVEGKKFPDGRLLLIMYKPVSISVLSTYDRYINPSPSQKVERVRFLIYEDSKGEIQSKKEYETVIQEIVKKTGMKIPPPVPYKSPVKIKPEKTVSQEPPKSIPVQPVETPKVEILPPVQSAMIEEVPKLDTQSKNRWLFILLGLCILLAVVFLFRKRKK